VVRVVLGRETEALAKFHRDLAERAMRDPDFQRRAGTACEMDSPTRAAWAGSKGTRAQERDAWAVAAPPRGLTPAHA
jgi:hypothetical protein